MKRIGRDSLRLFAFAQGLIVFVICLAGSTHAAEMTEHRRALLIGNENAKLTAALKARGFSIATGTIADSLPGIPHHGFNLIYYHGTASNIGGKWNLSGESLVAQEVLQHLQNRNIARHNVILFDLQNGDDESLKSLYEAFRRIIGRYHKGGLVVVNRSAEEQDALADGLITWLKRPESSLRNVFVKSALVSGETDEPVILRGDAVKPVSRPERLIEGGTAGDEWLAPDGMSFVWCPPGKYVMGDAQFYDAQPVPVVIERGFWIGKYELSRLEVGGSFTWGRQPMLPAACNVDGVLNWLNEKEAPDGWTYDLPSEAEWEYAARAGSTTGLPAPIEQFGRYANFADRSLYNAREEVHFIFAHREIDDGTAHGFAEIGRYLPNAWGIHDMFGNASEFCAGYYSEELTGRVDYSLKTSRDRRTLVLRGGAWCTPLENLHVAYRTAHNGDENQPYSGARLVLRRGKRLARSYTEVVAAKKAEEAAAREKR